MLLLKTKIKEFRAKHNMNQQTLAELVGVRRETIGHMERGNYNPSLKLAWDIAKVFNVPIEEIFDYEGEES
ncbi:helix-turn-helix transcriptional regulator [Ferdinandcohnia sp. Marseille-Q9671]